MPLNFAIAVCFLCGFTDLKLFDVQSVEVLIAAALFVSLMLPNRSMSFESSPVIVKLLPKFLTLIGLIFIGSVLSLRLTFYPPGDFGFLKNPPWASFIRLIQVTVSMSAIFIIALAVKNDPSRFKRLISAYVACGVLNAIWGIFCWIILYTETIKLPGVYSNDLSNVGRIRGFFVEGGPLGVYLVGVIVLHFVRYYYLSHISRNAFFIQLAILVGALIGSQSKAAVLLLVLYIGIYLVIQRQVRSFVAVVLVAVPLAISSNAYDGFLGYYKSYERFAIYAHQRSDDPSLVMGRMMATVLLPRMVEAHPIIGIGIGNYSLVRNDPNILKGLPATNDWDLHGLGILGYLAELGIPLTIFTLWFYIYPILVARKTKKWIFLLSFYPILAAMFGVQLNFVYPWVVSGFVLAAVALFRRAEHQRASHRNPLPFALPAPAGGRAESRATGRSDDWRPQNIRVLPRKIL